MGTVDAFKRKVVSACRALADVWTQDRRNSLADHTRSYQSAKHRNVEVTDAHEVMLFDPGKGATVADPQAGIGALDALRLTMASAYEDPTNWKRLDPTWTFSQCASRFGVFASDNPPLLRVIAPSSRVMLVSE